MGIYKSAVVLLIVTVIAGGVLGGINAVAKEPIRIQEEKTLQEAMRQIYENASDFKTVEAIQDPSILSCYEAWDGDSLTGYILETANNGYGGEVVVLTGVNIDGSIAGVKITSHAETAGLGANAAKDSFLSQYKDKGNTLTVVKSSPGSNEIEAVTSATITSNAVTDGVNQALAYCYIYLGVSNHE